MFYFHDMLRNYCLENAISILNKNAYGYNDFKNVRHTCKFRRLQKNFSVTHDFKLFFLKCFVNINICLY